MTSDIMSKWSKNVSLHDNQDSLCFNSGNEKESSKFTQLRKQIRDGRLQNIIFVDDKLFGFEETFNNHNDRVLSRSQQSVTAASENAPESRKRRQF